MSYLPGMRNSYFSRKEEIPLEAVCAYIEAKHTLHLQGDGRQSLTYAKKQVGKVKALHRRPRQHGTIDPYMNPIPVEGGAPWWPDRRNPVFTAIVARHVAMKAGDKKHLKPDEISPALKEAGKYIQFRHFRDEKEKCEDQIRRMVETDKDLPDMLILGEHNIMLPYSFWRDERLAYITPFNLPPQTQMWHNTVQELAFGVGISSLLFALDTILLDKMPWQIMVRDALVAANPDRMATLADLYADDQRQGPPSPVAPPEKKADRPGLWGGRKL